LHGCILDEDFPYCNEGVEVPRISIHSGFYHLENEVARLHGAALIFFQGQQPKWNCTQPESRQAAFRVLG
jgi:hypothetical protein